MKQSFQGLSVSWATSETVWRNDPEGGPEHNYRSCPCLTPMQAIHFQLEWVRTLGINECGSESPSLFTEVVWSIGGPSCSAIRHVSWSKQITGVREECTLGKAGGGVIDFFLEGKELDAVWLKFEEKCVKFLCPTTHPLQKAGTPRPRAPCLVYLADTWLTDAWMSPHVPRPTSV